MDIARGESHVKSLVYAKNSGLDPKPSGLITSTGCLRHKRLAHEILEKAIQYQVQVAGVKTITKYEQGQTLLLGSQSSFESSDVQGQESTNPEGPRGHGI